MASVAKKTGSGWTVEKWNGGLVIAAGKTVIADVQWQPDDSERANASLLAAAPGLLTALANLAAALPDSMFERLAHRADDAYWALAEARDAARAAIVKAGGVA